jgi:hypothetical protein
MIEVLKQAYQLLLTEPHAPTVCNQLEVILRQAIAELESQEPMAHQKWCASLTQLLLSMPPQPAPCNCHPPQRTWVGLTDEEQMGLLKDSDGKTRHWLVWQVEAKLKELNT